MNTTDLRQKDVDGLKAEVKALQKAHFGLRMQKGTQQLTNTASMSSTRLLFTNGHSRPRVAPWSAKWSAINVPKP